MSFRTTLARDALRSCTGRGGGGSSPVLHSTRYPIGGGGAVNTDNNTVVSSLFTTTTTSSSNSFFVGGKKKNQILRQVLPSPSPLLLQEAKPKIIRSVRTFHTWKSRIEATTSEPGSRAFADTELLAVADLFYKYAHSEHGGEDEEGSYLCPLGVKELLASIGERPDDETLKDLFRAADLNDDGKLHLDEFLLAADKVLGGAPARVVLIVGGPGSGKGVLCSRLAEECGVIHLSCGNLLRDEVTRDTPLGRDVASIMSRGELVSSAVIVSLLRRHMRDFPGRRVLLDGFPRSLQNAIDFAELCGKPELALNLYCDDTILMERILNRAKENQGKGREDDSIETALKRLRTFHKSQGPTLDWLKDNHVPVINLDCSGSPESVWEQLLAIGRLMRPATQLRQVGGVPVGNIPSTSTTTGGGGSSSTSSATTDMVEDQHADTTPSAQVG